MADAGLVVQQSVVAVAVIAACVYVVRRQFPLAHDVHACGDDGHGHHRLLRDEPGVGHQPAPSASATR